MHRVNDRRAVVLLCPLAHECHVNDRVAIPTKRINGREYPTVDASNLMWIKQIMDSAYYDRDYLLHIWTGLPPEPARPHSYWLNMLFENTGMSL